MYGMLYGMVWPDLQHESMVWYGMMASLIARENLGFQLSFEL